MPEAACPPSLVNQKSRELATRILRMNSGKQALATKKAAQKQQL